jgi:hypothetical protein
MTLWLKLPEGVPADIDVAQYDSLVALMDDSFTKFASRVAYSFMGKDVSYRQTDSLSQAFGAYLQGLGLVKGDRVAVMMPNVPQYPVAVAAILRAGLVLVNVNPLYTARELEHQLKDSGAKAIVILENFAGTLEKCIAATRSSMWCCARWATSSACSRAPWSTMWCATSRSWCRPSTCPAPCASMTPLPAARAATLKKPGHQGPTTWRCCNTPAAPPACPRAPCCCTATWSPTCCRTRPGTSRS